MDTKGKKPSARKQASKKKAAAPGPKGAKQKRPSYDWERIGVEYRAGQLSIREISKQYGPTDTAIRKRAKAEGWERDLSDEVRKATKAKLVRSEVRTPEGGSKFSDEEIVDAASERAVQAIELHRADIKSGREAVRAMLDQLLSDTLNQETLEQLVDQVLDEEDASIKRRMAVERAVSLPSRAATAASLTTSLKNLIGLERQALGIDDNARQADPLDELLSAVTDQSRGIGGYGDDNADGE